VEVHVSNVSLTVVDGGRTEKVTSATALRRRAKTLSRQLDTGYMELAKILYQIWDTPVGGDSERGPLYTAWGYLSFADYVEEELGIDRRKAQSLKAVWYRLEIELTDMDPAIKKRIVALGWTKVRELIRVLDLTNALDWVEQAEKFSYATLCAVIKTYLSRVEAARDLEDSYGDDDDHEPIHVPVPDENDEDISFKEVFALSKAQRDNIQLAITRAGELSGSRKKGHNLDLICTDFLATNDFGKSTDPDRVPRILAKLERALGVSIIALDNMDDSLIFGVNTLDRLAAKGD